MPHSPFARQTLRVFLGTACLSALTLPALAEPAATVELPVIVVYANQAPTDARKVGSSVSVLSESQIAETGAKTVSDALRTVPGLAIAQTGGRGSLTEVRIRGAEANHLLVIIDGVPVNAFGDGGFDFADLPVDDIERIEVVRGPQSGLYGANAHAGVISIVTKSGKGAITPEIDGKVEYGSRGTASGSVGLRAAFGPAYGAVSVSDYRTDGYNIAKVGGEKDASRAFGANLKGGIDLSENLNIEGSLSYASRHAETDPQNFFAATAPLFDSPVGHTEQQTLAGRVAATFKMFDDRWIHQASYSTFQQDNEAVDVLFGESHSAGTRDKFAYKNTILVATEAFLGAQHSLTTGFDTQRETYTKVTGTPAGAWDYYPSRIRSGYFAEYGLDLATGTSLTGALRYDDNKSFADVTTWRATISQKIEATATRFHASAGKGVTEPTFTELYGFAPTFFIGNPSLKPETSIGWDAGVEQTFLDGRIVSDVTYFSSRFKDKITTVFTWPTSTTVNAPGTATRKGFEATLTVTPFDWLSFVGTYTYTIAENSRGLQEARIPQNAATLDAVARFLDDRGEIHVGLRHSGNMIDSFPANSPLPSFTVVNASASFKVDDRLTIFARAENLFDEEYEEVYQYRAPGFEGYIGAKVSLQAN